MTLRTHKIEKKNEQHNQEWSWEETPEVLAAIEQLDKSHQAVQSFGKIRKIFVPNKNYPTIKKKRKQG